LTQTFKLALGGRLLDQVLATAAADEVSTSEVIRRILWSHFEGEPQKRNEAAVVTEPLAEAGPNPAPIGPEMGPDSALADEIPRHRSASLPTPLPSPQGRGLPQETKATAKTKAPASGDSLYSRCSGGAREAPAYARPEEGAGGPDSARGVSAPAVTPPATVLWLPCRAARKGDPSAWGLSQGQVDDWQAVFPGLDVLGEARKAEAWLQANPGRWKTPRGIARFLFSWLERTNDGSRFGRREATAGAGGGRTGSGWSAAIDPPAAPPKGSLREAYGRDSFEEWEAELRGGISDPAELAKCLLDLAKIRAEWQAKHAA